MLELTDIAMDPTHTLVGTPNPPPDSMEYAAGWAEAGNLSGWLGFDASQAVEIEALGLTLCSLLCPGDCADVDPTTCANPPAEIPGSGGVLGYQLTATVGAAAVAIAE